MNELRIRKEDLDWASAEGLIESDQVAPLWRGLQSRAAAPAPAARFDVQHLLWYGGALLVMIAMGWVGLKVWENFSDMGLVVTSLVYGLVFAATGIALGKKPGLNVPGGLLVTVAVTMVPLAVFGLEHMAGWWSSVADMQRDMPFLRGLAMQAATVVAALAALRVVRFPFLTAPMSLALWLATLNFAGWIAGVENSGNAAAWITAAFGLVMVGGSLVVDRKTTEDYAFWGHLAGATAFWGGITALSFDTSEAGLALYCAVNLGMMLVSVILSRKIFVVFGALGVVGYLGHLTFSVFANSVLFPFALTFLGVATIGAGIVYARYAEKIEAAVRSLVPGWLASSLPAPRG